MSAGAGDGFEAAGRHGADGTVARAVFAAPEAELLGRLADEMRELLEVASGSAAGDPVLARLLPDAYRGDAEASAEFRRYTAPDLLAGRVDDFRTIAAAVAAQEGTDPVTGSVTGVGVGANAAAADGADRVVRLNAAEASAWLRALAAARITLAERLGLFEEPQQAEGADGPGGERAVAELIYDWLGFVQDSLVRAVDR